MTERHHYKYVVLDSSKENGNAVQARFNVQIPHGITNASRVCVKSFSMPNVIHSVYGDLKTVRFVEFYRPTAGGNWVYDIFRFTLPDGYDETADLVNTMQAKFTNNEITRESDGTAAFTHPGQTDTPTTVYYINIVTARLLFYRRRVILPSVRMSIQSEFMHPSDSNLAISEIPMTLV